MGQRYNKNAKTGDCGFQKVALEVSEVKLRKKKQAANCISFCKCTGSLQDRSISGKESDFLDDVHTDAYGFFVHRNQVMVTLGQSFVQGFHYTFDRYDGTDFQ